MKIEELKEGDVLLFSAEKGSFISWAITFLTDAPVSHAAMYYNKPKQNIIEETPPQVAVNHAPARFKDREIHVRRFKKDISLEPVINVSTTYLNNEEPYDNSGLYLVGALLLYKKFTANTFKQRVIIKILKKVTYTIVQWIHHRQNPGKSPMVCSQFVAQCYDEAGIDYQLEFSNKVLAANPMLQDSNQSLLARVMQEVEAQKEPSKLSLAVGAAPAVQETGEELCKELKALEASGDDDSSGEILPELVQAVTDFSHAHTLLQSSEVNVNSVSSLSFASVLSKMESDKNTFTFPGDLLNHCVSLEKVGIIK